MTSKLKTFTDGLGAARHTLSIALLAGAGIVSVTLIYAQVAANEEKAADNEAKIEAIQRDLGGIKGQQQVIINEIEGERRNNKEFRDRTDSSLGRILDRVSAPRGPTR